VAGRGGHTDTLLGEKLSRQGPQSYWKDWEVGKLFGVHNPYSGISYIACTYTRRCRDISVYQCICVHYTYFACSVTWMKSYSSVIWFVFDRASSM
jgi:hypothetical protein